MTNQRDNSGSEPQGASGRDDRSHVDAAIATINGLCGLLRFATRPLLFLLCGALLLAGLGVAQRQGWISAGGKSDQGLAAAGEANVRYICPMMCTPPQSEPGRCPVCAMELVPASSASGTNDSRSVEIAPVARRVANIRTATVRSMPVTRTIRAVGEVSYDEGTLRTISAYVDGRIERLYADYTGVVVNQGDHLALVYSPRLYSAQVELLLANDALQKSQTATRSGVTRSSRDVYESAKQRLIELGMTDAQIAELEAAGKANSRLHLCAPISGTVIEKRAVEGAYMNEGEPIYKLADLSTVWLMLELFPEDAAAVRFGQKVEAEVQSLPGQKFFGRVAFVDPVVDQRTRTVGVRVVIPNDEGLLRVGDYAKATLEARVVGSSAGAQAAYDAELAGKWISPRHPHVIRSSPGQCSICGIDLVPAARFGISPMRSSGNDMLVIPRNAVLMAGDHSVVYVETEPGRFEIRPVVLGPSSGGQIVVFSGVTEGEQVATRGNFLIDSQMQLAGNPSLMDPAKANDVEASAESGEIAIAMNTLAEADRAQAEQQSVCPVSGYPLGSMGTPAKVRVAGETIFICCEGCREPLLEAPESYLAHVASGADGDDSHDPVDNLPPIGVPRLVHPTDSRLPAPSPSNNRHRSHQGAAQDGGPANHIGERVGEGMQ